MASKTQLKDINYVNSTIRQQVKSEWRNLSTGVKSCSGTKPDVRLFTTDGCVADAHSVVLAHGEFFAKYIQSYYRNANVIEKPSIIVPYPIKIVVLALKFLYTGKIVFSSSSKDDLLACLKTCFGVEENLIRFIRSGDEAPNDFIEETPAKESTSEAQTNSQQSTSPQDNPASNNPGLSNNPGKRKSSSKSSDSSPSDDQQQSEDKRPRLNSGHEEDGHSESQLSNEQPDSGRSESQNSQLSDSQNSQHSESQNSQRSESQNSQVSNDPSSDKHSCSSSDHGNEGSTPNQSTKRGRSPTTFAMCKICHKRMPSGNYESHVKSHYRKYPVYARGTRCFFCKQTFRVRAALERHVLRIQGQPIPEDIRLKYFVGGEGSPGKGRDLGENYNSARRNKARRKRRESDRQNKHPNGGGVIPEETPSQKAVKNFDSIFRGEGAASGTKTGENASSIFGKDVGESIFGTDASKNSGKTIFGTEVAKENGKTTAETEGPKGDGKSLAQALSDDSDGSDED